MIKTLKYIALICSSGLLLSCGGNDADDKKAMEPEEVVKAFTSAVAGGDFAGALELCDTVAMKGYIEERQNEWHMLEMKDSSVYAIAAHMLEGTETEITEVIKEGLDNFVKNGPDADKLARVKEFMLKKEFLVQI